MNKKLDEILNHLNIDDFISFYSTHNIKDTAKEFNISVDRVTQICKNIGFKKDINIIVNQIRETKIKNFGSLDNLNKQNKINRNNTLIKKYGSLENATNHRLAKYQTAISEKEGYFSNIIKNISKEEFIDFYLNQNKSRKFLKSYYNISESILDKIIEHFNCHKPKRLASEIGFQTKFSAYDSKETYFKHIQEKAIQTKIDKYGSLETAKSKLSEKCRESWNIKSEEEKIDIRQRTTQTCLAKYGVENCFQLKSCRLRGNNSQPNIKFSQLLENHSISYEREFAIGSKSYDFKVEKYLIEINPYFSHNSTFGIYDNEPLDKYYHYNKSKLAFENGYICIHVFDWTDKSKVIDILKGNLSFDFKQKEEPDCYIYNSKTKISFLRPDDYELKDCEVIIYDDGNVFHI